VVIDHGLIIVGAQLGWTMGVHAKAAITATLAMRHLGSRVLT
jgi:hypothetical protein